MPRLTTPCCSSIRPSSTTLVTPPPSAPAGAPGGPGMVEKLKLPRSFALSSAELSSSVPLSRNAGFPSNKKMACTSTSPTKQGAGCPGNIIYRKSELLAGPTTIWEVAATAWERKNHAARQQKKRRGKGGNGEWLLLCGCTKIAGMLAHDGQAFSSRSRLAVDMQYSSILLRAEVAQDLCTGSPACAFTIRTSALS